MHIEMLGRGLVIHAPAKVNLFLEVLGKRGDGYHQIDSVICPVSLLDTLRFEANDSGRIEFGIRFGTEQSIDQSTGSGQEWARDPAWTVPDDRSNLVVRALESVRSELGCTDGCRVELHKNIPAAAGLGGGSSDAAAAIVAGLAMWDHWDRPLATRVAAQQGSDIPLFLGDRENGIGLARATGRGELIEMLPGRPPLCFVISHPPVGSSTAEVYKLWNGGWPHRSIEGMLAACAQSQVEVLGETSPVSESGAARKIEVATATDAANDIDVPGEIEESLFNALQSPASQLTEWIERQVQCFAHLGKTKALMSGSGSACFTLVRSTDEGQELVEKLIAFGLPRAYTVQAWYAPPIEQQLERIF